MVALALLLSISIALSLKGEKMADVTVDGRGLLQNEENSDEKEFNAMVTYI